MGALDVLPIAAALSLTFIIGGTNIALYSYFAWFTNIPLRSFFESHNMPTDVKHTRLVVALCCLGAILSGLLVLASYGVLYFAMESNNDTLTYTAIGCSVIEAIYIVVVVILTGFTAKYCWDWWHWLAGSGEDYLARNCKAFAILLIIQLCLLAINYIFGRKRREARRK